MRTATRTARWDGAIGLVRLSFSSFSTSERNRRKNEQLQAIVSLHCRTGGPRLPCGSFDHDKRLLVIIIKMIVSDVSCKRVESHNS